MKRLILTLTLFCAAPLSIFHFPLSLAPLMAQTDRGFIHPGGLHTQADFDRVKAQLAAGNSKVKQAFAKLKAAAYAQSSVQTYPVETIVRGGGNGENYINACRGAAMAYGNALRWKIDGTDANAKAAVRILMAWANTTKAISGDSNYALAAGLYGYQFAQAAELMRDYEGWSREDFATFQRWMLDVWYPSALGFLRARNGTWENAGKWWQAPGHYWSNWGLCNALCVSMIGILCDDVFIYNQGMSYFKYDQVGTYKDVRTEVPIKNDGLTEFLGNLVVTTYESELETAAYGRLGQMNESGRDTGHSAMALGLAVDLAKVGWNQGDDLFAYMSHRLAAGIEYIAAQTQSVENLPWVNYQYGQSGYYYTDSRAYVMEAPALGAQNRPYWGTVIGIYEGVKGVQMPFSETSYTQMGIDEGGQGGTSGGYDHLGYSVLMNTRDVQLCPADQAPTELSPKMEYSGTLNTNLIPSLSQERARKMVVGKVISHNELGGLVNTFTANNNTCVPTGQTLKLMPQLPDGEEDTGNWRWNTGETTRDITVSTDRSYIYRVTYTNAHGIESQLCFPIAVAGDCTPDPLTPSLSVAGSEATTATNARVLYGKTATLSVTPTAGWGTYQWTGNKTAQTITTSALRKSQDFTVNYKNQGGAISTVTFHLDVMATQPYAKIGTTEAVLNEESIVTVGDAAWIVPQSSLACDAGADVTLGLTLPSAVQPASVEWSTGEKGATLTLTNVQQSQTYTAHFVLSGEAVDVNFLLLVRPAEAALIEAGDYLIRHIASDTYLTANSKNQLATFEARDNSLKEQVWSIEQNQAGKYKLSSEVNAEVLCLTVLAKTVAPASYPFLIDIAEGTDRIALHTGTGSSSRFWNAEGGAVILQTTADLTAFPFQLIPIGGEVGISNVDGHATSSSQVIYDLSGRRLDRQKAAQQKGIYLQAGKKLLTSRNHSLPR